jgi:N-methylhydantoinase B
MRKFHPDMAEGDAFLHNDPYLGNTHTADYTVLVPVYVGGQQVFTASAKAHQADCGNSVPTTYMTEAVDIYHEGGLVFPCVRVQRGYSDVEDVIRMCQQRIRVPEMWYGDYLATLGAARIGERRLKELAAKYGVETLLQFIEEWLDYSERLMVDAIRQVPSGSLAAESAHDPFAQVPDGVNVRAMVEVDAEAGRITVDLTENQDCVDAGVNLSEACSRGGALIGVFNCLDPAVPRNAGSFRRVDVRLRENCVVGVPLFPHSCSAATTNVLERVINAIQAAFAGIGEGFGLAEGGGANGVGFSVVSGHDARREGAPFVNQIIMGNNGGPATPTCDGWITYVMPDAAMVCYIDSVEVTEQKYPLHFHSSRLVTDSGGAGKFRGGPAGELVYGPKGGPVTAYYYADFARNPARGVWGGRDGGTVRIEKIRGDGTVQELDPIGDTILQPGERLRGTESGGGGYGDPLARDPEMVRVDVLERWVSPMAAREVYGVMLEGDPFTEALAVDIDGTERLRTQLRAARKPT